MEPISSSILSLIHMVLKSLELVHKRREGKLNEKEAKQLFSKIYSSLLWEIRQNLDRCYMMKSKFDQEGIISAGVLSFFVRESLFSDFCIMCPEPRIISDFNQIYSAFERIHHWQRLTINLQSDSTRYIIGYAKDLFEEKRMHEKYNELVDVVSELSPKEHYPRKFSETA